MVTALEHFCGTFLHCRLPAQPSEVTCEVVSLEVARQCDSVFLLSEVFRWWYNPCIYHEYFFRTVQPMEYMGNSYFVLKNQVIKAERRMLKVSGCHCCHNIYNPVAKENCQRGVVCMTGCTPSLCKQCEMSHVPKHTKHGAYWQVIPVTALR